MNRLEMIKQTVLLHDEMKSYINAFEATGDESLLLFAYDLQDDLTKLEIELSYN